MNVFIAFLILCVVIGGSRRARPIRDRPLVLLAMTAVVALSFYSLRVVL